MPAPRLLLLEEDQVLAETVRDMLQAEGFQVSTSGDGHRPDLVLGGPVPADGTPHLDLVRPVRLAPLIARIRDILDKVRQMPAIGPWRLDQPGRRLLGGDGQDLRLTDKECGILALLAASGQTVERGHLLQEVWGYGAQVSTHTLETHIYRLRRKLADAGTPDLVETRDGGYGLKYE